MLQFITNGKTASEHLDGARAALAGGCRWIQLRMKDATDEEVSEAGKILAEICHSYGATFILDDRVHLVESIGADGVHLGKNDMPHEEARKILGNNYIIGATANTVEDTLKAIETGADYLGVGPFRFTTTKKNLSPLLGIEGLKDVVTKTRKKKKIPIVAIGGIEESDISDIMQTGVTGIAISGTILKSPDPEDATRRIMNLLKR